MIFGFLPLLILGGIVALIVRAVSRRSDQGPLQEGTVTIRRFFQYVTLYGVLVVVAIGITGILEQLLPGGDDFIRRGTSSTARSLAFVIVGTPVYLGIGAWVRSQLTDPGERRSLGWSFYLTLSLITSLLVAGFSAFELLTWAFGAGDYDESALARGLVWGAVWVGHWFIAGRYLDAPRGEGHLIGGSVAGLIASATAIGFGLTILLDALYSNLFEVGVASGFGDDAATALAGLIVGGAVWWLYWLRHAIRLPRTPMWHAYVLLLGVLSGLSAAIGSGTTLLYRTLEWWLGNPLAATGVRQFKVTPALAATALVGLGVFFYHRAVLQEAGGSARTEIRRVYEYIIAALGLFGLAGGITVLLIALIRQLVPAGSLVAGESETNTLLGAVTFLVVGGPIWWGFWSRIQRIRAVDPDVELRSKTRRFYLTVLFGVGGITALISLIIGVFVMIEAILDGRFGAATMDEVSPTLALVITTGAVAGYHWLVYKEDRAEAPAALTSPLKEVILIGVDGTDLATKAADELDVRVTVWDRLDGPGGQPNAEAAIAALGEQVAERVMLIAWPDGYQIVPIAARR